ncbi:hypothetical protein GCM10029976_042700 [Kribbella albertanoniae]|uniref:Radical SAM protein n=1 Tax=Kribbella albertanoniae TaxID=1266829 RepID=A0A4R4QEY2_9ACTN|nr:radical SAM protein [Kribbella albertanoniae]TDC34054.1 radical SAM protein [Kribbella albertanoniae]
MRTFDTPDQVIWDITYACPMRCIHCYSESGRRPSRKLGYSEMLRIADAIVSMAPRGAVIAGGEPLLIPTICDVIRRIANGGVPVTMYTSGWQLSEPQAQTLAELCERLVISLDGPTPEVHDRIRGRVGSFAQAMDALRLLNEVSAARRAAGQAALSFGIDCVLLQSNFDYMQDVCKKAAVEFSELQFITFGAVIPAGLANRTGFEESELLTEEQLGLLNDPTHADRLRALVPGSVEVNLTDNRFLQMHPDLIARGLIFNAMQLEPDGEVRAMAIYEGTVGNILTEPPTTIWQRAQARWRDPIVVETLSKVQTMRQWAEAARQIDYHFGSETVRARIDRRPTFPA